MRPGTASAARCKVGDSSGMLGEQQDLRPGGGFVLREGNPSEIPAPLETSAQLSPDFPLQEKKKYLSDLACPGAGVSSSSPLRCKSCLSQLSQHKPSVPGAGQGDPGVGMERWVQDVGAGCRVGVPGRCSTGHHTHTHPWALHHPLSIFLAFSPPISLFSSLTTHPCNFQATPGWPHGSGAEGTRRRARRAASTCQRINTPLSSALFTQSRCAGDGSSLSKRGPRRWVNIQYFI